MREVPLKMKPSSECIDLVKGFEGFKAEAYKCPAGVWTVGYGTTENVYPGDVVNEQEAEQLLLEDLVDAAKAIDELVDIEITQRQYDALTSFVYNVGREAFRQSTMLKLINGGNMKAAALQFQRWTKANGKVLAGLVKRRAKEKALFEADL